MLAALGLAGMVATAAPATPPPAIPGHEVVPDVLFDEEHPYSRVVRRDRLSERRAACILTIVVIRQHFVPQMRALAASLPVG